VEETVGYEALFSADEWDALPIVNWQGPKHTVTIWFPPGESDITENRYELECDICKVIGAADSEEEAEVQARLHEALKATEVRA
jgi:hypothetical protein